MKISGKYCQISSAGSHLGRRRRRGHTARSHNWRSDNSDLLCTQTGTRPGQTPRSETENIVSTQNVVDINLMETLSIHVSILARTSTKLKHLSSIDTFNDVLENEGWVLIVCIWCFLPWFLWCHLCWCRHILTTAGNWCPMPDIEADPWLRGISSPRASIIKSPLPISSCSTLNWLSEVQKWGMIADGFFSPVHIVTSISLIMLRERRHSRLHSPGVHSRLRSAPRPEMGPAPGSLIFASALSSQDNNESWLGRCSCR